MLDLSPALEEPYARLVETYRYAVTPYYLSLIDWDDPQDPIRLQTLPDLKEITCTLDETEDPLGEKGYEKVPGLLHRYPDRVLAIVTNRCSTYCRHCMRKRLWKHGEGERSTEDLNRMVEYVGASPGVREVILSGGDPLTMSIEKLDWFLGALRAVPHVEVLRIGSRMPAVLPMRVDETLCVMLEQHRPLWFNTQFNHPREVTPEAAGACEMLLRRGIPISNQSVLLRGVNDSVEIMRSLCYALQRIAVHPYYLFQCDPVRGTGHFRTSIWTGINIIEQMRRECSGLAVPAYMLDTPGKEGKIPLYPQCRVPWNGTE
jgi:lysine 2,3-aminomutase